MFRFIRSLFAWRAVRRQGTWVLKENTVTGQRKAIWVGGGYSPLPAEFLDNGDIVYGPRGRYVVGTESEILRG